MSIAFESGGSTVWTEPLSVVASCLFFDVRLAGSPISGSSVVTSVVLSVVALPASSGVAVTALLSTSGISSPLAFPPTTCVPSCIPYSFLRLWSADTSLSLIGYVSEYHSDTSSKYDPSRNDVMVNDGNFASVLFSIMDFLGLTKNSRPINAPIAITAANIRTPRVLNFFNCCL